MRALRRGADSNSRCHESFELAESCPERLYLWCTRLLSNKRRESSLLFGPSLDGVAAPV